MAHGPLRRTLQALLLLQAVVHGLLHQAVQPSLLLLPSRAARAALLTSSSPLCRPPQAWLGG